MQNELARNEKHPLDIPNLPSLISKSLYKYSQDGHSDTLNTRVEYLPIMIGYYSLLTRFDIKRIALLILPIQFDLQIWHF